MKDKKSTKKLVKPADVGLKVRQARKEIDDLFSIVQKGVDTEITKKPQTTMNLKTATVKSVNDSVLSREKSKRKISADEESKPYGVIQSQCKTIKIVNPEAPLERIDPESGLPVYKAHLLKVGEGGGTPLCPFDCDCCF